MANPAFGSPEWRAKYMNKPKVTVEAPKPSNIPPYLNRRRSEPHESQPIGELAAAITNLERAVAKEPEQEDQAALRECLERMKRVQAKNKTE